MTKILKAEDILQTYDKPSISEQAKGNVTQNKKIKKKNKFKKSGPSSDSEDDTFVPTRGRIVSGRFWKSQKTRASSAVKSQGSKMKFKDRQIQRAELKRVKELSRAMEQERNEEKLAKKRRREENLKRAEENRIKNEVVQVVKNSAKIKKMRKKQKRMIEKRDVTNVVM